MRAYIRFFGVRKRARETVIRKLQTTFPDLRVREVPGCDIAPAAVCSIICRMSELPDGYEPFVSPDGRTIPISMVPDSLRVTKAYRHIGQVLECIARTVDSSKVHRVTVCEDHDPASAQSVAWGPGVSVKHHSAVA